MDGRNGRRLSVLSHCMYKWKSQLWEIYSSIFHDWRKMERPLWILDLIVPFLGKIWLEVGQDGKSWQYYPVNASVPQNSILGPACFLPYTYLLDDVICKYCEICKINTNQNGIKTYPTSERWFEWRNLFLVPRCQDLEMFSWKY